MNTGLEGSVAVVTGAGQGIGLSTVELLVAEGARVVAADLDPAAAVAVNPEAVAGATVDLATPEGPATAVELAVKRFGRLDVLVNNVGIAPFRESFTSVTDADWTALIELNFLSAVRACRAAIPHMLEAGGGSIVSLSSDTARLTPPFFVDYSVTKGAIVLLSRAIANEYARAGIRSNTVSPGVTRTPPLTSGPYFEQLARELGTDQEGALEHFTREIRGMPLGRAGEPEDVARVIVFLASDLARQVTGTDYRVDGGQVPTPW